MDFNIFLFLSIVFLLTFIIGKLIEIIHIPWIFSSLLIGFALAIYNPFTDITTSSTFDFLAQLGMYLLLFIIGFEIDLKEMKKQGKFIIKTTTITIFLATFLGTLLIFFLFVRDIFISIIVSLSFATVGEEILIPILDEFKLTNEPLGQTIIGVGTLDDIFEIFTLILVILFVGTSAQSVVDVVIILVALVVLFILTIGFIKIGKKRSKFKHTGVESLFVFVVFVLFLFIGVGFYAEAAPLAALFAGIGLKTFLPKERLEFIESEIKTVCYGLFAPLFFLWVGASMDLSYLLTFPISIILVVIVGFAAKLLGSYLGGRKTLGKKDSLLVGIGVSVKFSTGIVVMTILLSNELIDSGLYSVIIASSIIFTFFIPIIFANLISKRKSLKPAGNNTQTFNDSEIDKK
ncbi:MAG: cation:proton antiporter [Candidatus Lokiarchaeia archaeon]|nr:cation:proton antiporter [Candidatus Lokiarchaeia archaeon]